MRTAHTFILNTRTHAHTQHQFTILIQFSHHTASPNDIPTRVTPQALPVWMLQMSPSSLKRNVDLTEIGM